MSMAATAAVRFLLPDPGVLGGKETANGVLVLSTRGFSEERRK